MILPNDAVSPELEERITRSKCEHALQVFSGRGYHGEHWMKRETGEKIIAAMKRMDAVPKELDIASWEIEDIEEKSKILREIANIGLDADERITLEVGKTISRSAS